MSLQIGDKICISGFVTCAACTTSATVLPSPQYTSFQCLLDSTCPTNYEILAKSQEGSFCRAFRLDDAGSERLWSAGVAYDEDEGRDDRWWGQVFPVSFRGSILDLGDEFMPATVDVDFSYLEFEMGGCENSTIPVFCVDSFSAGGDNEGDNSGLQDEVDDAFVAEIFVDDLLFPVTTSPSTDEPRKMPTDISTESPSTKPTEFPKITTSTSPTEEPSIKLKTEIPSFLLSRTPTEAPSRKPTKNPSKSPTNAHSFGSFSIPITKPAINPTVKPTLLVTKAPLQAPTRTPSTGPTETSTGTPSLIPTSVSSMGPSSSLSESPSLLPRSISFDNPTFASSTNSTLIPSNKTDTNSTATTLTMFNDKYSQTYFPTCAPSENSTIPEESIESPGDNDYTLETDNDNDINGTIPTTIGKVTGSDAYATTSQQNEIKKLFSTHGKIAGITWGVLLPLAMAVPWLRDAFPSSLSSKNGVGVSGASYWLVIHMGLTIISAVSTSVALYLAIKALTIEGGFEYAEKFFPGNIHKSLGLFLSIGIWVQVLGGIFRPSKISDLSDSSTKGSSDEDKVGDVANDDEEGIEVRNHGFLDMETNSQQNDEFVTETGPPRSRKIWGSVHRLLALWLVISGMWQVTSGFNVFESRYGKESVNDILELWYWFWIGIYWFVVMVLTYFYKQF